MATGTAGTTARELPFQAIHFLRVDFTFADALDVITIGTIPAGSVILKSISGVHVSEVFDAGTNNRLDIGTTSNDDLYGTDLSLLSLGPVVLDEAVSYHVSADTTLTATVDVTGTAATTGVGQIIIAYVPDL